MELTIWWALVRRRMRGRRPIALHFFFPFPFFFFFLPAGGFGSYIAVSQSCLNSGLISKKVRSALSRLRFVYKRRENIVRDLLLLTVL